MFLCFYDLSIVLSIILCISAFLFCWTAVNANEPCSPAQICNCYTYCLVLSKLNTGNNNDDDDDDLSCLIRLCTCLRGCAGLPCVPVYLVVPVCACLPGCTYLQCCIPVYQVVPIFLVMYLDLCVIEYWELILTSFKPVFSSCLLFIH